ncbi:eukaryotic cytochrome b561 domain-containing protein [Phthorimaea operculella]|nr:eukaryotic cytochrome b561 domain-containing protein [Phthorimaea operculella]
MNDSQDLVPLSCTMDRNARSSGTAKHHRADPNDGGYRPRHSSRHFWFEDPRKPVKCPGRKIPMSMINGVHVIFNLICQLMIGAVNMLVLKYSMKTKDVHAVLCCAGWHLFTVEAVMTLIMVNSWGGVCHKVQRRSRNMHMILQVCSLVLMLSGEVIIVLKKNKSDYTAHAITGFVASLMMMLTIVAGPTSLLSGFEIYLRFYHVGFGLPTFILSSVVLILGLFKKKFKNTTEIELVYSATFFIAFYTIYVTVSVIVNIVAIIKSYRADSRD